MRQLKGSRIFALCYISHQQPSDHTYTGAVVTTANNMTMSQTFSRFALAKMYLLLIAMISAKYWLEKLKKTLNFQEN